MEIWVLSSVAVYYDSGEYYMGTSVHTSLESAHESMVEQLLQDVSETWTEDMAPPENSTKRPPQDEDELRYWFRGFEAGDAYVHEDRAKLFIGSADFGYKIEKYTMKWEVQND